jgi:sugar/nucleoside kinase (ribokinase family)
MNPEVITIGSCTLDCMLQVKDILRFELLDKDQIKKYTAIEYSRKLNVERVSFVPGGSAANIASNCAMLGLNSAYLFRRYEKEGSRSFKCHSNRR